MTPKRPSRGLIAQIDSEIRELDRERARLAAARAALARKRPRRLSQDEVADYLGEHPGSTYIEIADGLRSTPRNIAAHPEFAVDRIAPDEIGGLTEAVTEAGFLRTLPCHMAEQGGMDGFYAARLIRSG